MKALLLIASLVLVACQNTAPEPTSPPDAALFPDKSEAYTAGYGDGFRAGVLEGVLMTSGPAPKR